MKKVRILIFLNLCTIILLTFRLILSLSSKHTIYVSLLGDDRNNGNISSPIRSLQHAVDITSPGNIIRILPGIYREEVEINKSVLTTKPITIIVDPKDRGEVIIAGSEASSSLIWHSCTIENCPEVSQKNRQNIYVTTLPWIEKPYLINEITTNGSDQTLHLARSPNIKEDTATLSLDSWWKADKSQANQHILTDPVNLRNYPDLTNSDAYIMDGADRCGNFLYVKKVDNFDNKQGNLLFTSPVGFSIFGSQENGIGPKTIYYLEGKLTLLDAPGEWFFDEKDKKLYIWTWRNENPQNVQIEISRRKSGITISVGSNIIIDGLSFKYLNDDPYYSDRSGAIVINPESNKSLHSITIQNISVQSSFNGINIQNNSPNASVKSVSINKSHLSNIQKEAILVVSNKSSNISRIKISDSEFDHNGSYSNLPAISIVRSNNIQINNNMIHDNSSYGIHVTGYEKNGDTVKNINIEQNHIYRSCQNISSCAGIKIYGGRFNNSNILNNYIMDNQGWSNCSTFAHGVFISNANGISLKNNVILQNSGNAVEVYPRQIEANNNIIMNNLMGYSSIGVNLSNPETTTDYSEIVKSTRHDNTVIKNNIFMKNKTGIKVDPANQDKLIIDYNAYITNVTDFVSGSSISNIWNTHSIASSINAFKDVNKNKYNLVYSSQLRGKGESIFSNTLFIGKFLNLIGLGSDIGPCPFRWFGDSCPVLKKK